MIYKLNVLKLAVTLGVTLVGHAGTLAATITNSGISTMPLSNGSYTDANPTWTATYTKPSSGLVIDALTTLNPKPASGNSGGSSAVRSIDHGNPSAVPRNNGQTFTVDASQYEHGIDATAFVIQFERRGNGNVVSGDTDTFSVRLYRLAEDANYSYANPNYLPEPTPSEILVSGTGLSFPTAATLGVATPSETNNGASGTAIFQFSEPVLLAPGAYAFQFLPNWGSQTGIVSFEWALPGSNAPINYAGGRRIDARATNNATDYAFGVIGTAAVPVPEPSTLLIAVLAGVLPCLWRQRNR